MLLTEARRGARTTVRGELVPLDEQDQSLWDRGLIAEGVELARDASSQRAIGEYLIRWSRSTGRSPSPCSRGQARTIGLPANALAALRSFDAARSDD